MVCVYIYTSGGTRVAGAFSRQFFFLFAAVFFFFLSRLRRGAPLRGARHRCAVWDACGARFYIQSFSLTECIVIVGVGRYLGCLSVRVSVCLCVCLCALERRN